MQKINRKINLTLLCVLFTLCIALRCAMSYEFITSIILFALAPFILVVLMYILESCNILNKASGISKTVAENNIVNGKEKGVEEKDIKSRVDSKARCGGFCKINARSAALWAMGLFALSVLAFALVFAYHAFVRGGGDLIAGLRDIYEHDFLRRMVWGSARDFNPEYAASLNAGPLTVVWKYMNKGICLLLCVCVIACFIERDSTTRRFYIALLVTFSLPALSWFVLGKSHSFIHTHFCPVLWNLGFWAALFYVPFRCFFNALKN